MANPASQSRSFCMGVQSCETSIKLLMLAKYNLRLYNEYVHTLSKHAKSVFIFRPLRATRYLKVAFRCWRCEQSSRPFRWRKYD